MKPLLRLSKDYIRRLSIFTIPAINLGIAVSYVINGSMLENMTPSSGLNLACSRPGGHHP